MPSLTAIFVTVAAMAMSVVVLRIAFDLFEGLFSSRKG